MLPSETSGVPGVPTSAISTSDLDGSAWRSHFLQASRWSRVRWFLVELGIAEPPPRTLGRAAVLAEIQAELTDRPEMSVRISRDLVLRIREWTSAIEVLEREIQARIAVLAPTLLGLTGCGPLSAAKLVGETGGIDQFRSRAAFAAHNNGTAPIPVWSGNIVRHRLNRAGNRQLNLALHRIAVTQLRCAGAGRDYVVHRMTAGDTKTEAIRTFRSQISDEVFRRMTIDY